MIPHTRAATVHRVMARTDAVRADAIVTGLIIEFVLNNADDLNITRRTEQVARASEFDREPLLWLMSDEGAEKLLGLTIIKQGANASTHHVGQLRVAVDKDSWNQGIGTKLLAKAIEEAPRNGISRLEATPYMPLDPYKYHLFIDKGGFEIEGVKRHAAKKNGQYVDVLSLVRFFQ